MWQRESQRSGERRKKGRPDTITARVVCCQSRIWTFLLKCKRFLDIEPHSNWLHDWMFDFRCNFKIMAAAEGDANSKFSAALTVSLEDFIHKLFKDEQIECIRRVAFFKDV